VLALAEPTHGALLRYEGRPPRAIARDGAVDEERTPDPGAARGARHATRRERQEKPAPRRRVGA
jgi:hypothetical protein